MATVAGKVHLAVVGHGIGAERWRRLLEVELARTQHLTESRALADAVVVVIGPSFFQSATLPSNLPLGAQRDCFAMIRDAPKEGKLLLPVMIGGAESPHERTLPAEIRHLAHIQTVKLDRVSGLPGVVAGLVGAAETWAHRYVPVQRPAHRVFISYRRDDSWYWASLLAAALTQRLGSPNVFFDIGSIAPGRRFDDEILRGVREATDLVILVGPNFLGRDETGGRRIDDSHDLLRREIASGIRGGAMVHVVLILGTSLPDPTQLPSEIGPAFRLVNPLHLDNHETVGYLADTIIGRTPETSLLPTVVPVVSPQEKGERFLRVFVPHLSELGWRPVDPAESKGVIAMAHPSFEGFRFEFDFQRFDLVLQEHARSAPTLGLMSWIERARFPFSPDATETAALTMPAPLVEAMNDPSAYLDRIGRMDMESLPQLPKGLPWIRSMNRAWSQPGPAALTQHAREREEIRQRGGLAQLTRVSTLSLGEAVEAHAVAFDPATKNFVVSSSEGLYVVGPCDTSVIRLPCHGNLLTVAVSLQGRIAATDYDNRITVLNTDGSCLVRNKAPYSPWQRRRHHERFVSLSWHDDGTRLAIGGSDHVWILDVATRRFRRIPLGLEELSAACALFVPASEDLVIAQAWMISRVSTVTQERICELDTSAGSDVYPPTSHEIFTRGRSKGFVPVCLALSRDARRLAIGGQDGMVVLLDSRTLRPLTLRVWHHPLVSPDTNGRVEALAYSPDGAKLASVANDDRLVVGEARQGDPLAEGELSQEETAPYSRIQRRVCWSADGSRIAVSNGEGRIEIFALQP